MYKKTVLRRLCKLIDLDFDVKQQQAFNDGGDFSFEDKVVEEAPIIEASDAFKDVEEAPAVMEEPIQEEMFDMEQG